MILWLTVIVFVACLTGLVLSCVYWWDIGEIFCGGMCVFGVILFIELSILAVINLNVQSDKEVDMVKYESLIYKLKSDECKDEFGLLKKEIVDEVIEWNKYVTWSKSTSDNFWIGIFVPDIYDDYKTIDLYDQDAEWSGENE